MAKTIDIKLKKQLDKPQVWFCKYFPSRIRNVGEKEKADRQLVFDFKDGRAYEEVAQLTATQMSETYGKECANIVFSPVPTVYFKSLSLTFSKSIMTFLGDTL